MNIIRQPGPLKIKGLEQVVDDGHFRDGNEVDAPVILVIVVECKEEEGLIVVKGQLRVAVRREPPEPDLDVAHGEKIVEIGV